MTLVATRTFTDPSDGLLVEAGKTYVHESADVARSHPQNFKSVSCPRRGGISRIDETVLLGNPRPRPPKRPAKKTPASASSRPYWLLGENEPWRLR
jgi:hypothetical protein